MPFHTRRSSLTSQTHHEIKIVINSLFFRYVTSFDAKNERRTSHEFAAYARATFSISETSDIPSRSEISLVTARSPRFGDASPNATEDGRTRPKTAEDGRTSASDARRRLAGQSRSSGHARARDFKLTLHRRPNTFAERRGASRRSKVGDLGRSRLDTSSARGGRGLDNARDPVLEDSRARLPCYDEIPAESRQ